MIFSELYSAYYNTVAGVLRTAVQRPIDKKELWAIVEENASGAEGRRFEFSRARQQNPRKIRPFAFLRGLVFVTAHDLVMPLKI